MSDIISEEMIMETLDWAYDQSINGLPGMGTAEDLVKDYLSGEGSLVEKVDSLIGWQNAKCATSGFLTGLGGIITLPVAIPANISSVLYVQVRMIAAIAYMGGFDIRNDKVKTLVFVCLCGSAATDILKDVGIKLGEKLAEQAIGKISGKIILEINQAVGFRLITKFGENGILNLGKLVPVFGGLISGVLDEIATNTIGEVAKDAFIANR